MQLDPYLWLVVVGGIACFMQGFGIGANDVANNFGTALGAGAMKLWVAVILASVFELVGCVFFGSSVTDAVRSKILDIGVFEQAVDVAMYGNLCALLAASTILITASQFGLPISTTHSIVGGLVGFGIAAHPSAVDWFEVGMIVVSWIISPALSALVGGCFFVLIRRFVMRRSDPVKAGYQSLWALVVLLNVVFVFFFVFKNSMTINTSCLMPGGVGSPCKVSSWAKANTGMAVGICFGLSVACALLMMPFAYYFARRGMDKFGAEEEVSQVAVVGDGAALAVKGQDSIPGVDREDFQIESVAMDDFTADEESAMSCATVSDGSVQTKVAVPKSLSRAWWRQKWHNMPWFSDLCEEALLEDRTAARIHSQHEDFGKRAEHFFKFLQVITASINCVVHGSNDVANAAAPFATIYACFANGYLSSTVDTPLWILLLAGGAISMGLALFGYRVIKSVGMKITKITPCRAFAIELGAALVILLASSLGIPVSSTQCTLGSAVGVGLLDHVDGYVHKTYECGFLNFTRINWKLMGKIAFSWAASLVIVMAASAALFAFGAYGPTLQHSYYDLREEWPSPPQ
eukprot:Polyplicarium_translucidae@DN2564_c0_g1_i1.p1